MLILALRRRRRLPHAEAQPKAALVVNNIWLKAILASHGSRLQPLSRARPTITPSLNDTCCSYTERAEIALGALCGSDWNSELGLRLLFFALLAFGLELGELLLGQDPFCLLHIFVLARF